MLGLVFVPKVLAHLFLRVCSTVQSSALLDVPRFEFIDAGSSFTHVDDSRSAVRGSSSIQSSPVLNTAIYQLHQDRLRCAAGSKPSIAPDVSHCHCSTFCSLVVFNNMCKFWRCQLHFQCISQKIIQQASPPFSSFHHEVTSHHVTHNPFTVTHKPYKY